MAGRREYNGEDISEKPWRVKHWELWGEVSPGALLRVWCGEARLGVAGLSGSRDPPPPPPPAHCSVRSAGGVFQSGLAYISLILSVKDGWIS